MQIEHNYVIFNGQELKPYLEQCRQELKSQQPHASDVEIEKLCEEIFPSWLKNNVEYQSNGIENQLFGLATGPSTSVKCYNGYYVNGFTFHTQSYGRFKKTMNSEVCVKGSCYDDNECDYYGMLKEVVRLKYLGSKCKLFLFKCNWYDTK